MFCVKCGVELQSDVSFCPKCGASQQVENLGSKGNGDTKAPPAVPKVKNDGRLAKDFQNNFPCLPLSSLTENDTNAKEMCFSRKSGTVLEHKRSSETHVSSSGGGGYVGKHGGHVAAAKVHSDVVNTDDFWILNENGEEEMIRLVNVKVALREGQRVTLILAGLDNVDNMIYMFLFNHTDGQLYKIHTAGEFLRRQGNAFSVKLKQPPIHVAWFLLTLIIFFPLVVPLFIAKVMMKNTKVKETTEVIREGLAGKLKEIDGWVRSDGA